MSNIIDKIQVSGVTYDIGGSGGGVPESTFTAYTATTDERISQDEEVTAAGLNALNDKITPTIELTQAQYDALATKDPNTYYIITDAQAGDLTNYYTKSETNTLLGGKQDQLVSGTNIKTINNESILGSGNIDIQGGGGKAVSGGTNISITTGETADTINCTLPLSAGSNDYSVREGQYCTASGYYSHAEGQRTTASTTCSHAAGFKTKTSNTYEFVIGKDNISNKSNTTFGDSGNTLFAIGNGGDYGQNPYHNAFEVRQSGDIYIADTNDTSTSSFYQKPMIKLQDALGGGGGGIDSGTVQTMIDQSISGKTNQTDFVSHSGNTTMHVTESEKTTWNNKSDFSGDYNDLSNKLSAGTNITIVDNVISAEGGSDINVVQTTGTSTADVMSQSAVTNAFNTYTVRKDSDNGIVRFWTWKSPNYPYGQNSISNFAINGKCPLSKENGVNSSIWQFNLVETSAITTSVTSASTDIQVPSAKAVNDKLGGLSLVKLSQSEYDSLATKDNSTLYVIVN